MSKSLAKPFAKSNLVLIALAVFAVATAVSLHLHSRIDSAIFVVFNHLSRKSYVLDHAANDCTRPGLSGVLLISLVYFVWFKVGEQATETRAGIVVGVVASACAAIVSRVLQVVLPTHSRPLQDQSLHLIVPFSVGSDLLHNWSSYPSDHASLYIALATTILLAHRRTGYIALGICAVVLFVRVYLGLHFPSDIVGGAALGALFVYGSYGLRKSRRVQALFAERHRPLFYAIAFYVCYSTSTLFADVRDILVGIGHGAAHLR